MLLGLVGCDGSGDTETQVRARQQAIDPPQLWIVQVIAGNGEATASTFVCADAAIRETFARTRAEVNGKRCEDTTGPVQKAHEWALSCRAQGREFAISASTLGDVSQDFWLNFALTPLFDPTGIGTVRQTRHFRNVGPCPNGWRIGDQAKPGHQPRKSRLYGLRPSVRPGMPAASR